MFTNIDPILYNVNYQYELKDWLSNEYFYHAEPVDYMQAFIAAMSFTCVSFKETTLTQKYGLFVGNVYEKTVETNYDVQVNLKYNGSLVETKNTTTGAFNFTNLNPDLKYSMEFVDLTNKYNPKMLIDLQPDLDINQEPKINIHNYPKYVGDNIQIYFDVVALGNPQVSIARAPIEFKVEKINETTYAVMGDNRNRDIDFDILLDDFRDSGLKSTMVNIKQNKRMMLDYRFNNSLTDTSGKYTLTKVGNPVLSSDHISIDGEANTIKYDKTDVNDNFSGNQTSFTLYIDLLYKGPKNVSSPAATEKILVSSAITSNVRFVRLVVVDNKYLAMRFGRSSGSYTGTIKFPYAEIAVNNRYRIKLVQVADLNPNTNNMSGNSNRIYLYLNDKLIDGYSFVTTDTSNRPEIVLQEFGPFLFGHLNNSDPNNHTLFDLYEFKFANYVF